MDAEATMNEMLSLLREIRDELKKIEALSRGLAATLRSIEAQARPAVSQA